MDEQLDKQLDIDDEGSAEGSRTELERPAMEGNGAPRAAGCQMGGQTTAEENKWRPSEAHPATSVIRCMAAARRYEGKVCGETVGLTYVAENEPGRPSKKKKTAHTTNRLKPSDMHKSGAVHCQHCRYSHTAWDVIKVM